VIAVVAVLCLLDGCASAPPRTDAEPTFFPPPPAEPRLQLLASYSGSNDVEEVSGFRKFVAGEEVERRIGRAHGVAWHDGRIYVCDPGLPHVVVIDLAKKEMRLLDPERPAMFKKPLEIAIAPDGWKYITDTAHRKVIVYDSEDRYRKAFGDPDSWRPVGIAADADRLYVSDAANHAVVVLERASGTELMRFGEKGSGEGDFFYPTSLALGPEGDLYVSDSFNFRIQRLESDGAFVRSVGSVGRKLGNFARPKGVAVDREGRIYALDGAFDNCQIFDPEGKLLLFFGGAGGGPGSMNLPAVVSVEYDAVEAFRDRVAPGYDIDYVVFVSSQAGPFKVNVYGLLRKR
jgi:sugar lactone lactonase YvrE